MLPAPGSHRALARWRRTTKLTDAWGAGRGGLCVALAMMGRRCARMAVDGCRPGLPGCRAMTRTMVWMCRFAATVSEAGRPSGGQDV